MSLKRAAFIGIGAAAAGVGLAAGMAAWTGRRWAGAEDPCRDEGARDRTGEPFKVTTDDGAVVCGVVLGDGSGPVAVLSHCWTGDRSVWMPVAHRLVAAGRTVVLYDQRGHGASTTGTAEPTISRLGADLAAVLVAVEARDAVVAGHSMGGMAIMALLTGHPAVVAERVAGAVLVATAAARVVARPQALAGRHLLGHPGVDRLLTGPAGPAMMRATVGRRPCLAHLQATRDTFLATAPDVRLTCFASIRSMDLLTALADVTTPTTVVVGARDLLTPPRRARAIAAALPGARLVTIPGAGHMLPYEAPDRLADLIAARPSKER